MGDLPQVPVEINHASQSLAVLGVEHCCRSSSPRLVFCGPPGEIELYYVVQWYTEDLDIPRSENAHSERFPVSSDVFVKTQELYNSILSYLSK